MQVLVPSRVDLSRAPRRRCRAQLRGEYTDGVVMTGEFCLDCWLGECNQVHYARMAVRSTPHGCGGERQPGLDGEVAADLLDEHRDH